MSKYRVYGIYTGSKFLGEFDAESKDAAIEMALNSDANHVCLCHQCSDDLELNDYSASTAHAEVAE